MNELSSLNIRHRVLAELLRLSRPDRTDERRAIVLHAQGYSYAEIRSICGWTHTKVNRCLVEGRARLREQRP